MENIELWLCDDCTHTACYSDYTDITDERRAEIDAGIERLGNIDYDGDCSELSTAPCDCCETRLHGDRTLFTQDPRAPLKAAARARGIPVADDHDWRDKCFVLWFGAYPPCEYVLAWGDLDDALENAAEKLHPGHFCEDQVQEEYERKKAEYDAVWALFALFTGDCYVDHDERDEWAHSEATVDCTYTESGHLASWEWGIAIEDPTLADIESLKGVI